MEYFDKAHTIAIQDSTKDWIQSVDNTSWFSIDEYEPFIPNELIAKVKANSLTGEDFDAIASIIQREFDLDWEDAKSETEAYIKLRLSTVVQH